MELHIAYLIEAGDEAAVQARDEPPEPHGHAAMRMAGKLQIDTRPGGTSGHTRLMSKQHKACAYRD